MIKYRLGCDYVVVTIFSYFRPHFFRNRLIPRQTKFLVMDTKLDFPFFKGLLSRSEVVYVRIRYVISFAEETVRTLVDYPL